MKEYIGRDLHDENGNITGREYSGELIRCGDCKYYDEYPHAVSTVGDVEISRVCKLHECGTTKNKYCAWAMRKDPDAEAKRKSDIEQMRRGVLQYVKEKMEDRYI